MLQAAFLVGSDLGELLKLHLSSLLAAEGT